MIQHLPQIYMTNTQTIADSRLAIMLKCMNFLTSCPLSLSLRLKQEVCSHSDIIQVVWRGTGKITEIQLQVKNVYKNWVELSAGWLEQVLKRRDEIPSGPASLVALTDYKNLVCVTNCVTSVKECLARFCAMPGGPRVTLKMEIEPVQVIGKLNGDVGKAAYLGLSIIACSCRHMPLQSQPL